MSMWEIRGINPEIKNSNQKELHSFSGITKIHPQKTKKSYPTHKVPAELLILGRFGVSYNHLTAAIKLSNKYQLHPSEILIRGKVITLDIWRKAQAILRHEIQSKREKKLEQEKLLWNAINALKYKNPKYSAVTIFEWKQVTIILMAIILVGFSLYPENNIYLLIILFLLTAFYTLGVLFRSLMLAAYNKPESQVHDIIQRNDQNLPIYCVLVALYKESNQIASLTNSLSRLDWPKHLLDIKLICEEDDAETIKTIVDAGLPNYFQLVIVPAQQPRTKPKALNYALPMCHGTYLVLYDAEDIPSPGQLREAYLKFQSSDEKLACLQAPLLIHNAKQNWLTRMFAIEYETLFTGILPILSKWYAPLPLGGTSNHFRLSALRKVGGWDPYNVTEDADLGIRLFRYGYRCGTLTLPTFEECPPNFIPWLKQRTRWIKGWMQTILVHNREPIKFLKQLGMKNMLMFHLFLTTIVISTLIHPMFLYICIQQIIYAPQYAMNGYDLAMIATSIFNLVGGYTTYGLLAYAVLQSAGKDTMAKWLFTLPLYWLLISIAAWRALIHLFLQPHKWEKTPHGLANQKSSHKKLHN